MREAVEGLRQIRPGKLRHDAGARHHATGRGRNHRSCPAALVDVPVTERDFKARLQRRARRAGVTLTPTLTEGLAAYFDLLCRWNSRINLTSLVDRDEAIDRLILEPLVAVRQLPATSATVVDIGSGGGSPAVPLKLAVPQVALWMVEAKTRKAAFLREVVRTLGLTGTIVETSRYEELLARPDLHEAADLVTIRAVRLEGRVLTSLQAFLKPGGRIWLFRGPIGPDVAASMMPPLQWEATFPLVESLRSRLVVLRKAAV